VISIDTSHGTITLELFEDSAPLTCENFRRYAADGFYEGTVFHRVIPGFMIQGGGLDANLSRKPTRPPIENEAANGEKNLRGTIAMARTADVHSATSQFFINLRDNAFLDHGERDYGYAVFGRVVDGMDVVDAIAQVATESRGGHQDVPVEPVTIRKVNL